MAMGVLEFLKEGLAIYSNASDGSKLTQSDMGSVLPGDPHHVPVQNSPLRVSLESCSLVMVSQTIGDTRQ
jgi:hypothetical protein